MSNELISLLKEARDALAEGLEGDTPMEHEWSIADKQLVKRIDAALNAQPAQQPARWYYVKDGKRHYEHSLQIICAVQDEGLEVGCVDAQQAQPSFNEETFRTMVAIWAQADYDKEDQGAMDRREEGWKSIVRYVRDAQQAQPADAQPTLNVHASFQQYTVAGSPDVDEWLAQQAQEQSLLDWAVAKWDAEVANRPLVNVHRRTLDDTWRQVIRYAGGDDVSLIGPRHDDLVAAAPPA